MCWALGTAYRVFQEIDPGEEIFWLTAASTIMEGLFGFFNAVVYGLNETVQQRMFCCFMRGGDASPWTMYSPAGSSRSSYSISADYSKLPDDVQNERL